MPVSPRVILMSPRRAHRALFVRRGGGAAAGGMRESRRRGSSERGRPGAPRSPSRRAPARSSAPKAPCREGRRPQMARGDSRVTWWLSARARPACAGSIPPPLPAVCGPGAPPAPRPPCRAPRSSPGGLSARRGPGLGHETGPGARMDGWMALMALTGPGRRCQDSAWLPSEFRWSPLQQTLEETEERRRRALLPRAEIAGGAELWGRIWVMKLRGSANAGGCKPRHCCP